MPPRQGGRSGLRLVGKAGFKWQAAKIDELGKLFGLSRVWSNPKVQANGQPGPLLLGPLLLQLQSHQFVVEAQFPAYTSVFKRAVGLASLRDLNGLQVDLGDLQPDLIQVLPPLGVHVQQDPDLGGAYFEEVLPDGTTRPMDPATDSRLRLRVLDIKLTSEPGAHYFAEVVFYSMALSAWLQDTAVHGEFAVVAAPAVVPGSLNESELLKQVNEWRRTAHLPAPHELSKAFEGDLELAPVEAFAPRIRHLVSAVLPRLIATPWDHASYHVDFRCKGCEFLGDPHILDRGGIPTQDPLHCWPQAEGSDHLSRVVGLSRGAVEVLTDDQIGSVASLAQVRPPLQMPSSFQSHHGLRARRSVYPSRAESLLQGSSAVIPDSGGDALMPQWPDLHIYLFLDYDPATGMTVAFGCRAFWKEPLPYGSYDQAQIHRWGKGQGDVEVFAADAATTAAEWREFQKFLRHLRGIMNWVQHQDQTDLTGGRRDKKTATSSYQIYLWDEAQRRHFVRLVSRYLPRILADPQLRQMAWLFPPPELLAHPETSTRRSPFTLVHDVVDNTVAIPDPHHYTLFSVARAFNATKYKAPTPHPLYTETLGNLIPPERIHEFWEKQGSWRATLDLIVETQEKKLFALGLIVSSLERQLTERLSRLSAPPIPVPPNRPTGLSAVGHLWHEFTRLNAALDSLDVHRTRAMPPHERAARFKSARLVRRLGGAERRQALPLLAAAAGQPLMNPGGLLVYELASDSTEFNARPGDFGYALSPEGSPAFLDRHPFLLTRGTPIKTWGDTVEGAQMTAVSIEAIDRQKRLIALRPGRRNKFRELTKHRIVDFSRDLVLDPVHQDYLSSKVRLALQGIGNPSLALPSVRTLEALGLPPNTPAGSGAIRPAAEVLWAPTQLYNNRTGRSVPPIRQHLEAHLLSQGRVLLADQWQAFEQSLERQLSLIWGPPGTGKSHTLRAIVLGAVWDAVQREQPLRVLISASTYTAVDNVLLQLQDELRALIPATPRKKAPYRVFRVQSEFRPVEHDFQRRYSGIANIELNKSAPAPDATELIQLLDLPGHEVVIVGCPTQQVHNLSVAGVKRPTGRHTQKEWFDFIVLDEATQVDVASSTLVLSARAPGGTCVLGGDDLQLPPIHQADPPKDLDHVVGSVYSYLTREMGIPPVPLNVSFRANQVLVDFTKSAGYSARLTAHSPDMRLNLTPVPTTTPANWPQAMHWSADLCRLIDADQPAVAVVYKDRRSAQSNEFEAEVIAATTWLLRAQLLQGLLQERDAHSNLIRDARYTSPTRYPPSGFWETGVGIVVPHRAQMSQVAGRLQALFPQDPPDLIRASVDTVERFQGQQRAVMMASFGLGDPDVIRSEEAFLYDLRRFNVMASRARAKLIVLATRSLIEHLSDDVEVLQESLLVKRFVEQFCQSQGAITLYDSAGGAVLCDLRAR